MPLAHFSGRTSFVVALAVAGCAVSATTSPADTCVDGQVIAGCAASSSAYLCAGTATPLETNSTLSCSVPTSAMGGMLYCCVSSSGPTTCMPNLAVAGCIASSQGFACTGPEAPGATNTTLNCGAGVPGPGGTALYCCANATSSGTPDAAGNDVSAESSDAGAEDAPNDASASPDEGGNEAGPDADNDAAGQAETGLDAGVCAVISGTGSAGCDQCLDAQCCQAIVACATPDDAGTNDAGASACEQLLQCTLDCIGGNPDAGLDGGAPGDCESLCNPTYTVSQQMAANGVLQCLMTNCSAQCQ
jgi:hypothetical protein